MSEPFLASDGTSTERTWLRDEEILRNLADAFYKPLSPSDTDQGDPYVLEVPEAAQSPYRFYIHTSDNHPEGSRAVPCYGSNDLREAVPLGRCLIDETPRCHWGPCVSYLPALPLPYVMLHSWSLGLDDRADIGHQIVRAHAKGPAGPFVASGELLTPDDDFAIDPDVYTLSDGRSMLAFAVDFVSDEPIGTGIVEQRVSPDLTRPLGERRVLARAKTEMQVYDPARVMPWKQIPGIEWERGDVVAWYTVEAPVHLVSPGGKRVMLYSTGSYLGDNYAVGALVEDDRGELVDVTALRDHFVIRSQPESGIFAPGHPSAIRIAGFDFLVIHMRLGSVEAPRQMTIVPLLWTSDGMPFCPSRADLAG